MSMFPPDNESHTCTARTQTSTMADLSTTLTTNNSNISSLPSVSSNNSAMLIEGNPDSIPPAKKQRMCRSQYARREIDGNENVIQSNAHHIQENFPTETSVCLPNQTEADTSTNLLPIIDNVSDTNSQLLCPIKEEVTWRTTLPCQSVEETNLNVKAYLILDELLPSKLSNKTILDLVRQDIMPLICRSHAVDLKQTTRLIDQISSYTHNMMNEMKIARQSGSSSARNLKSQINEQTWKCKVLADEFVKREDFDKIVKEEEEYQAEMLKIIHSSMDGDGSEKSVSSQSVAESSEEINFDATNLVINLSLLVTEIRNRYVHPKDDYKDKSHEDIARDIWKVLCCSKGVELKESPRLFHTFYNHVKGLIGRMRQAARIGGSSSQRLIKHLMEQNWHMTVYAHEFMKMEDFRNACIQWERHEIEATFAGHKTLGTRKRKTWNQRKRSKVVVKVKVVKDDDDDDDDNEDNVCSQHWPNLDAESTESQASYLQSVVRTHGLVETYIYVQRSVILQVIQDSNYPNANQTLQELCKVVFDATMYKGYSMVYNSRLECQLYKYVKRMVLGWYKAKKFSREDKFISQVTTGEHSLWRCKVLVEEFSDIEQFRKVCIEHDRYEANQQKAQRAESIQDEETDYLESDKETNLLVPPSQVLQSLMECNHPHTDDNVDDITHQVFEAFCQSKAFELIYTPRLEHQFQTYVIDMIKRLKHAQRQAGPNVDRLVKRTGQKKQWHCKVLAIEFPKRGHFHRARKEFLQYQAESITQKDTCVVIERMVMFQVMLETYNHKTMSYREKQLSVFDGVCKAKGVLLKHSPTMEHAFNHRLNRLRKEYRDTNKSGGARQKRRFMARIEKLPPYQIKVVPDDFETALGYEKVRREWELYDAKIQSEKRVEEQENLRKEKEQKHMEEDRLKTLALEEAAKVKQNTEKEGKGKRKKIQNIKMKKDEERQMKKEKKKKRKAAKRRGRRAEKHMKADLPYACVHCEWRFKTQVQLRFHRAWHTDEICCWCGTSFMRSDSLRNHLIKCHNKKQRRCRCHVIWDRTVRHCERKRENHMCLYCGLKYEFTSQLKKHEYCKQVLFANRKCCFCFESHVSLASLDRHKNIFHPRGRRLVCFKCKYCGKAMADFQSFQRHIYRHEKKYRRYWLNLKPVTWSFTISNE